MPIWLFRNDYPIGLRRAAVSSLVDDLMYRALYTFGYLPLPRQKISPGQSIHSRCLIRSPHPIQSARCCMMSDYSDAEFLVMDAGLLSGAVAL